MGNLASRRFAMLYKFFGRLVIEGKKKNVQRRFIGIPKNLKTNKEIL